MTFVLVTLSVMAASLYLIYNLTTFFGIKLKYKALLLCAVMAFAVNVVAVMTSPYLTQGHYFRLVLLVLIASGLVTAYNERLLSLEASAATEGAKSEAVVAPPIASERKVEAEAPGKEPQVADGESGAKQEPPTEKKAASVAVSTKPANLAEKTTSNKEKKSLKKSRSANNAAEPLAKKTSLEEDLAKLNTLDSLLDYAYAQKKLNEPDKAIAAYRTALAKYRDDDYVPFIIIDLGNTYKENAAYDRAIEVYQEALNIPIIADNEATYQEFANNLAYLNIVKIILAKHDALDIPFGQIPSKYMAEIEKRFQAGRGRL